MKRQFAITCGLGNSRQNEGSNLIEAAKSGDYTTIRRISADCLSDIHTEDKLGWTALSWAACKGHVNIVDYLIHVDEPTKNELSNSLANASTIGDISIMTLLLNRGADPDSISMRGDTPLVGAAGSGRVEAVDLLIHHGADVNKQCKNDAQSTIGDSPLSRACFLGYLDVVKRLIFHGANINITDHYKNAWTPLMIACVYGHAEIARYLLQNGALVNATDKNGMTALVLLCHGYGSQSDNPPIMQSLLEYGADVSIKDMNGESAASLGFETILNSSPVDREQSGSNRMLSNYCYSSDSDEENTNDEDSDSDSEDNANVASNTFQFSLVYIPNSNKRSRRL